MDFWLLSPELNSARIYAGAGSSPLMTAATWWDQLASELMATALSWRSITAGVCAIWTGPASIAMSTSASAYVGWLLSTATQAERTASQARAAAAAFEAARAACVPPPVIAANRAQLAALVATNVLGQNTGAIMALEAAYAQMWAQDVAAMAAYQAASAAATSGLPQFDSAPPVTTPGSGAADPATGAGNAGSILSGLLGSSTLGDLTNQYLQAFVSSGPYEVPIALLSMFNVLWAVASPASPITQALNRLSAAAEAAVTVPPPPKPPSVTASTGTAAQLGRLSAPRWAQPPSSPQRPPAARPLGAGHTEVPLPLPAPIPVGGTPPKQQRPQPEYGAVVRFVTRPPSGG